MKVFVKSIAPFFGENKCTNIRRFSAIFCHKKKIFSLQKVHKIQFWVKWIHNMVLGKFPRGKFLPWKSPPIKLPPGKYPPGNSHPENPHLEYSHLFHSLSFFTISSLNTSSINGGRMYMFTLQGWKIFICPERLNVPTWEKNI